MIKQTIKEFVIFCVIGFYGLLVNLAVTYVFKEFFGWFYFLAFLVGTMFGWTFIFLANLLFTFRGHEKKDYLSKYRKFVAGYALIFSIHASLVFLFTSILSIYYLLSIIIATMITTILTFTFSKKMVFINRS